MSYIHARTANSKITNMQTRVELHIFLSKPHRLNRAATKLTKWKQMRMYKVMFNTPHFGSSTYKMKYVPTPNPIQANTIIKLNHIQNGLLSLIKALYCYLVALPPLLYATIGLLSDSCPSVTVSSSTGAALALAFGKSFSFD
jgi:hypothetical protein